MGFTDATTLTWVEIDSQLLEVGYKFFINVGKTRSLLNHIKLEDVTLTIQLQKWQGAHDITGRLIPNEKEHSFIIVAKLSERLLHLTDKEKEIMQLHKCPFPETFELIANDIIRHEIAHIEHNYRDGNAFGGRRFWFEHEQSAQRVTTEFIEEYLILIEGGPDDKTLPLPFSTKK